MIRVSTERSEAVLNSISPILSSSADTSLRINQQLTQLQRSITETHTLVLNQTSAIRDNVHNHSSIHGTHAPPNPSYQHGRGFIGASSDFHLSQRCVRPSFADRSTKPTHSVPLFFQRECNPDSDTTYEDVMSTATPNPSTILDTSPNFFPELYSTANRLPVSSLLITSSYEESHSFQCTTNFYRLFYLKSPRQWRRLSMSVTVRRSSTYWLAAKLAQDEYSVQDCNYLTGPASIPHSLVTQVQNILSDIQNLEDDFQFCFDLPNDKIIQVCPPRPQACATMTAVQQILVSLDDLNCPWYLDAEVLQIAMVEPPSRFVSCVNGTLVYETKFARSIPSCEFLYNIEVLRAMDKTAGFAKLVGVVVGPCKRTLKSYLIEFPRQRWSLLSDTLAEGRQVSWDRREKWARQMIEAVANAHARGLVFGTLYYRRMACLVDNSDRLWFWRFEKKFKLGYTLGCHYPPEFSYFREMSQGITEAECPNITPKTDIYHLGMALWFIAEGFPIKEPSPVCMRAKCSERIGSPCDESHIDPVALPPLSKSVPGYYRDVVEACRAEDPIHKPAAWRLLSHFPTIQSPEERDVRLPQSMCVDLDSFHKGTLEFKFCDHCKRRVDALFFHCNICEVGDFDMCELCYMEGLHCYNVRHLLVELQYKNHLVRPRRYHSVADRMLNREVTEL